MLLSFLPFSDRMNEMEKRVDFSVSGDNNVPSTSTNVDSDANASTCQKRNPKQCKKCGRSVINLSCHQKDVHGMTKMRRKLDGYVTGKKKTPNRRVKFCPLSPCKNLKMPIFQLHKHLQTSIHKLKPNSPRYLKALADAPRASVAKVNSYLKQQRKRARKRKSKDEEMQHTNRDGSIHSSEEQMKPKETEDNTVGACEEGLSRGETMNCKAEDNTGYSDADYEELSLSLERKISRKSKVVGSQSDKRVLDKQTGNTADSDEEYDQLTSKVWKDYEDRRAQYVHAGNGNHSEGTSQSYMNPEGAESREENDEESASEDKNADSDKEYRDLFRHPLKKTTNMALTFHEPANDVVTVLSSSDDATSDSDYIYDGDAHSVESDVTDDSQSAIEESSGSLCHECDELLTELIEVAGEKNIEEGSFLDNEKSWKNYVKKFKDKRVEHGHRFKTSQEIADELSRVNEEEDDSYDKAFQVMFEGDESDNDEAIDTEWVPSDCELDEQENANNRTNEGDMDTLTEEFLADFYGWLIDVDGGYRSTKMAQQYRSQVQSVIRRLKLDETVTKTANPKPPAMDLLMLPGKDGVKLLKTWLSYAVDKYQPGTVRSYLMSLRLFYKFLTQERKSDLPDVSLDTLNARRDYMMSWSAAQKKKVLRRKLEKHDEDFRKLLSSEKLRQVCHGNQHVNAIKKLAVTSVETEGGENASRMLSDKSHCKVRDWLMTRLLIENSGSGVAANMTVNEFKEAVYYLGTEEDNARYRVDVKEHKIAGVYGAANVWIYDDLYILMDMYLRTVRSQFVTSDSHTEVVFVSSNGLPLTSSQVSTCVWRTFQREGVQFKGKVSATIIRKSLATGMHVHMPQERDHLAALSQHKKQTQEKYYRVLDKVKETDLGRRAVKKLVSLQNSEGTQAQDEASDAWTTEETAELKKLFQPEIETGSIKENDVSEKLVKSSMLKPRSIKAVVLKLRRLRADHVKQLEPPSEQLTSNQKVLRFLKEAEFQNVPSTSSAMSVSSHSSQFWRKFTEEQTRHLLSLTKDLVDSNAIKKEVVWQRVVSDPKALELGLITGKEDDKEIQKAKQCLTDKVRQEARKGLPSKKK